MKDGVLSKDILEFLHPVINGDSGKYRTPYLQGYKLVKLFNQYGFNDDYSKGFPSRWFYTLEKLIILNTGGDFLIFKFIEDFLDPRKFMDNELSFELLIEDLNKRLLFDGYQLNKQSSGFYKFSKIGERKELTNSKTIFEDIQKEILKHINESKDSILIAVAWVTNDKIIDALNKKYLEGLLIELIVADDLKNQNNNIKFPYSLLSVKSKFTNLMHHKFAIFDSKVVVSGSYNWTASAEFNEENITTITDLLDVERFKQEYKNLLSQVRKKPISRGS